MGWRGCLQCKGYFNDTVFVSCKSEKCSAYAGKVGEEAPPPEEEEAPPPEEEEAPPPEEEEAPPPEEEEAPPPEEEEAPPPEEEEAPPPEEEEVPLEFDTATYAAYLEHLVAGAAEKPLGASVGRVEADASTFDALEMICSGVSMGDRKYAVQAGIEQLYSYVTWTGRVAIVVYTEERQGFGDITLGLKTAQLFREELGCAGNQYDVAFVVDSRTRKAVKDLGQGFGIDPITLPEGDKFTSPAAKVAPQAFVRAPALQSLGQLKTLRAHTKLVSRDSQDIGFTEYAKEEPDSVPSGLKPKELGITVHHGLRDYRVELERVEAPARKAFRTTFLRELPNDKVFNAIVAPPGNTAEDLGRLVLGDRIVARNPFSIEPAERLDTEAARGQVQVLEQARGTKLYFGYSNRSGTKFIKVLLAFEQDSPDHLCVVHPSRNYLQKYWPGFKDELTDSYKAKLEAARIGLVEIVSIDGAEATTELIVIDEASPRSLRIVLATRVSPTDMLALFRASEPIAIVTGNQSTSEALSAGKTLIYECLAFKQNQQFMKDLFALGAAAVDKLEGNKKMANFYAATVKLSADIISGDKKVVSDADCEAVAGLLAGAEMEAPFHALSALACATKDLRARLVGIYIRERLFNDRELRRVLEAAEAKVTFLKYKKADFQTFFETLAGALAEL